jgi:hypothetical protein
MRAVMVLLVLTGCRIHFDERSPIDGANMIVGAPCVGYSTWPGFTSTYRVDPIGTNDWLVAEQACEQDGAHLIVVDDAAEHAEVHARVGSNVWIGLSDRVTEGTYVHATGAPLGYEGWPSTIQMNTGEDCVFILTNANYEDSTCVTMNPIAYACECDGIPASPAAY